MKDHIVDYLQRSRLVIDECLADENLIGTIETAATMMIDRLWKGHKIIAIGNGGSMADASHFASELSGKYKLPRSPIAAMALSDPEAMSCIANDFGYDEVFKRQVSAIADSRDILLAISTSGKSINIIKAIQQAQILGMVVIGLTGDKPTREFIDNCDIAIRVPSIETGRIQEMHTKIIHIIVELIEQKL